MDFVARKVGEGFERPQADNESAIDIKYNRLVDRLLELKKLPENWKQRLSTIHVNAAAAQKKLPPAVLARVNPSGHLPLDYLMVRDVRDVLKETAETTLFGGLAGEAGVWDKLVTAYERQNVWLAEAGLQLQRSVDYELPYLRKSAAQCDTQLQALSRRAEECRKAAAASAAAFKQECASLGVRGGEDLQSEVVALADALPGQLQPVRARLGSERVEAALRFYAAFSAFAHGSDAGADMLPTLRAFRDGSVTFSDADRDARVQVSAADAAAVPEAATAAAAPDDAAPVLNLDWSALDLTLDAQPEALDCAADEAAAGGSAEGGSGAGAGAGIDWGVEAVGVDAGDSNGVDAASVIDWGISISADDADGGDGLPDAAVDGARGPGKLQGGDGAEGGDDDAAALRFVELPSSAGRHGEAGVEDASTSGVEQLPPELLRLSYDSVFRARLVTDLTELDAFLSQRLALESPGGASLVSMPLPEELVHEGAASAVGQMRAEVAGALDALAAPQLRRLFLVSTSQKFVRRLVRDLSARASQEGKMLANAQDIASRQQEVQRQLMGIAPKQKELVDHLRRLRSSVAGAVGVLIKRRVNITGEISNW